MSHTLSLALSLLTTLSLPVTEQPGTGEPAVVPPQPADPTPASDPNDQTRLDAIALSVREPLAATRPARPASAPNVDIPEPPNGRELMISGAVLLGASIPLTGIGVWLGLGLAFSEGQDVPGGGLSAPLLVLGMASLLAGIPMVSVGGYRRNKWRAWERMHRVSLRPDLRHRTGSTSVGLTLRF